MSMFKLSHVAWDCKYPVVLAPRYRCKVFAGDVKPAAGDEIRKLCVWLKVEIIEGKVCEDHARVCLAIPPKAGHIRGNRGAERQKRDKDAQQVS